ncbi:hypothetical protein QP248_02735 [Aerococcus sp. UMB8608]|uniref:Uncharacterized protein n=1 Tax=Aerococcus sanguinicola TaxID=119206 RepID=A0A0X8F9L2_9LACT|nr:MULTISPECIES: hypothetical protein [Aerococcus]AMB93267.1 hypothetical protein AWM72_00025 [Aerococcus sanguinicola]MDK6679366.1 hypothetical protein [Aerococcus sp. UMB8608]MDK6685792.1 hypothetical protein [Aerococcus sp. UMB8623]OFT95900.1 hypothetical protein HMPREF3090_03510 [Aerococcus sp. HMSC23C02]
MSELESQLKDKILEMQMLNDSYESQLIVLKDKIENYEYEAEEVDPLAIPLKSCERYYYIDGNGKVTWSIAEGHAFEDERWAQGNVLSTEEEGKFEAERRKVETALKRLSEASMKGFEWGKKHAVTIKPGLGKVLVSIRVFSGPTLNTIYFASMEEANEAIESVGEVNIKKYIFGGE